jgi:hypothetical protein
MIRSPFCLCLAPLSARYICTQVIPRISHRSRLSLAELILPGSFNALRVCFMATHPLLDRNVPLTGRCFCKGRRTFQRRSGPFRDFLPGAGSAPDSDSLGILRGPSTRTGTPSGEHARAQKRKQPAEPAPASASAPKRRRKAADRDKEKERDAGRTSGNRVSVQSRQSLALRND